MEGFDLTLFKIGLENGVFDQLKVMNFIYGEIKLDRQQKSNPPLVWHVSAFNKLPKLGREQLVLLLADLDQKEHFPLLKSVHDVATEFAMCTLRELMAKKGHFVASDGFGYAADFSAYTTPADGVQEIINWANWGVELDEEVYRTAKKVLDEFLKDAPSSETTQQKIDILKDELCHEKSDLQKRINSLVSESNSLDALLLALKEDPKSGFAKGTQAQIKLDELSKEINDLTFQLADVYHRLGQAETYALVKMRFDV